MRIRMRSTGYESVKIPSALLRAVMATRSRPTIVDPSRFLNAACLPDLEGTVNPLTTPLDSMP